MSDEWTIRELWTGRKCTKKHNVTVRQIMQVWKVLAPEYSQVLEMMIGNWV